MRGDIPPDEFRQINVEAMADSKTTAQVLALRHLGFTDLGDGAEIVDVDPSLPAAPLLRARDVIVEIDGQPVATSADVVAGIRARKPGEVVHLRVERDGSPVELDATLGRSDDGRPLLGVRLTTKIKLPFEINIDSGKVVGPSAGLAYALELLDVLTPGELTGGVDVAVTGDLQTDGTVGPIGGVAQKTVAVRHAGVKVFLVPRENLEEAPVPGRGRPRGAPRRLLRRRPPGARRAERQQRPRPGSPRGRLIRRRNVGQAPPSVAVGRYDCG